MIGISVAANKEWNYVKECYKDSIKELSEYIYGEYFKTTFNGKPVLVYKCGARKSNASASTQYIIDQFSPEKIILIGTAAGINKQYSLLDILVPDTEQGYRYTEPGHYHTILGYRHTMRVHRIPVTPGGRVVWRR